MFDIERLKEFVAYFSFASFGGLLGHLMRLTESGQKPNWQVLIVESVSAGFVGLLALFLCRALGLSGEWSGVVVGMSGWMGATTTVTLLEVLVFKKLGLRPKRRQSDKKRKTD